MSHQHQNVTGVLVYSMRWSNTSPSSFAVERLAIVTDWTRSYLPAGEPDEQQFAVQRDLPCFAVSAQSASIEPVVVEELSLATTNQSRRSFVASRPMNLKPRWTAL